MIASTAHHLFASRDDLYQIADTVTQMNLDFHPIVKTFELSMPHPTRTDPSLRGSRNST